MDARVGIVTGRATAPNRKGSVPVRLLQVQLTDTLDVQTVQLVGQAGEESSPPDGSLAVVAQGGVSFKLAVGTDDGITPIMAPGGKRIYSTSDGEVTAEVKLDPDGSITVTNPGASISINPAGDVVVANGAASFTMAADGTFSFSGVSATFDCPIIAPEVTFNGIPGSTHVHQENGDGGGITDGPQ